MKTHNRETAVAAKVELRERVLAELPAARVLDCYCGPVGEMHRAVWHRAATYAGIDQEWSIDDERRRYTGDTLRVLRAIDLEAFDVFDIDAFGSPWEAATIITARRRWGPGERGGLVLTDGSGMRSRFGDLVPGALRALVSFDAMPAGRTDGALTLHRLGVEALLRRIGARQLRRWEVVSRGAGGRSGALPMFYTALTFEGQ